MPPNYHTALIAKWAQCLQGQVQAFAGSDKWMQYVLEVWEGADHDQAHVAHHWAAAPLTLSGALEGLEQEQSRWQEKTTVERVINAT